MTTTTATRFDRVRELLDALDWIHDGRVHSAGPSDDADVWLKRADFDDRCITVKVLRMQGAGFVERLPSGTVWRLTDDGRTMRDGIHEYAGSVS